MSTQFKGANHFIPLTKAKQLKALFKEKKGRLINPSIQAKDILPDSETFDRAAIDRLLQLPGCVGVRIYLGLDEETKIRLILVGVNENGEDLVIQDTTTSTATNMTLTAEDALVVEDGVRCPPYCPPTETNS